MIFKNNKAYNFWKWVASVVLPALASFILALGPIWGWNEWTVPVGATITALAAFGCTLLGISSIQYQKNIEKGGK